MPRAASKGLNFHDPRGDARRAPIPIAELREDALAMARRLVAARHRHGRPRRAGRRDRARIRRAVLRRDLCRRLAGAAAAADQLRRQGQLHRPARGAARKRRPEAAALPGRDRRDGRRRGRAPGLRGHRLGGLRRRPTRRECDAARGRSPTTSATCSIRAARPASRTASRSPTARCSHNLSGHGHGMELGRDDRVRQLAAVVPRHGPGRLLAVADRQPGVSCDYLKTEHFARRPLAWLDLISRNPGTTLSYSPTFGYDICARRISSQSHVAERFDLSRWRHRRQRRRHDPPRRDAELRQRLRRSRLQGERLHPQLRPRRSDAGGHA